MGNSSSAGASRRSSRSCAVAVLVTATLVVGASPSAAGETLTAPYANGYSGTGTSCDAGWVGTETGRCRASATESKQDGSFQVVAEVDSGGNGSTPGVGGAAYGNSNLWASHALDRSASGLRYTVNLVIDGSERFSRATLGSAEASGYVLVHARHSSCAWLAEEGTCWASERLDLPLPRGARAVDLVLDPVEPLPPGEVLIGVNAEGRASLSDRDFASTPGVAVPVPVCPPFPFPPYCSPPWYVPVGPRPMSSLVSQGRAISSVTGKLATIDVNVTGS